MKKVIYRLITGMLWAGWMLTVFLFSAQPAYESGRLSGSVAYRVVDTCNEWFGMELTGEQIEQYAEYIDHPVRKGAHMAEYAVFGVLSFLFLAGYIKISGKSYRLSLFIAAVYAATDEIHQLFVPGRAGRLSDVCIDTAGAAIGLVFLFLILKFVGKHCEKKLFPLQ